ncbi:thioredoxin domain-containing protein [Streptomyces sp. R302]|uniref:thioredoxin domain-containing protein n=1 Tax=unclassified Streptomyces TaxID=2593676 RepID=UPI00145F2A26|nr:MULTISPECIES: thioredoxin domain-containing protein [unclassified Streptomyces]NML55504.1 thioredoxin domain-containing protein [Streptomyces sp. R301]NML83935.1 thioredoxin domain-containing protein [Streptomyces sp. R302]
MNPAHTTGAHGAAVHYGNPDAPHVLRVFLELRDRGSRRMAETLLGTFRAGADEGRFVVRFHFAAVLDDIVGGRGSRCAVAALGAASDEGQGLFMEYLAALFADQPYPPGAEDRFADPAALLDTAGRVQGLRSPDFERKVTDGTYLPWAGQVVANFSEFGILATPAVRYDEEDLPVGGPDDTPVVTPAEFLSRIAD